MADAASKTIEMHGLPPGPEESPEHQARLWMEQPCELLERCQASHGDLFTLRLGAFGTIVIVADPDGVGQIFAMAAGDYECRHFNGGYRYVMGDEALFVQDGEAHRRLKRMVAPPFQPDSLAKHAETVRSVAARATSAWADAGEIRLRPAMHAITLECLLALVFGDREADRRDIQGWFEERVWTDMRSWKPWTALSRLRPRLCARIDLELERLRAGGEANACPAAPPSLLSTLVAARADDRAPLSNEEIHDQILMMMITAVDALAVAASWGLYRVAADGPVQKRLRAERDALDAGTAAPLVADLPYLSATMREVLRLHPVLPTVSGRKLTVAEDFRGYRIPAGITLAPCQYLVHRRADLFEAPLLFRPERFIGQSYPRQSYFPFGSGGRACLGSALAPLTAKLILSEILTRFRLDGLGDAMPATVRQGTLLAPDDKLVLRVTAL